MANSYNQERLSRHLKFVVKQAQKCEPLKYENMRYGFPVKSREEQEIWLRELSDIENLDNGAFKVTYKNRE